MGENTKPPASELAVGAMREKRADLLERRQRLMRLRDNLDRDLRRVNSELVHLAYVARMFGDDMPFPQPSGPMAGSYIVRSPGGYATVHPSGAEQQKLRFFGGGTAQTATPPPAHPSPAFPASVPKIKEVVLDRLRAAGEKGIKAAEIRQFILTTYGVETHEKTVGMTLYRHLKAGIARREGATWFFVPPEAEKKNPGGETPGSSNVSN